MKRFQRAFPSFLAEMSIAAEKLPLPHRDARKKKLPHRDARKTSYRAAAATRQLLKKSYRTAVATRWLINLPPPRHCRDGFQKNVPNFAAATATAVAARQQWRQRQCRHGHLWFLVAMCM
jgi:hypothetical protein